MSVSEKLAPSPSLPSPNNSQMRTRLVQFWVRGEVGVPLIYTDMDLELSMIIV